MPATKELSGLRFNRIVVIEKSHMSKNGWLWKCLCSCGNAMFMLQYGILNKKAVSCGCYQKEVSRNVCIKRNTTHDLSNTREYKIWTGMKRRCIDKKSKAYKKYGLLGISVCERWMKFENFLSDMGPSNGLSLDRINNNGNYEPNNCRWATMIQQANNKKNNKIIKINGEELTLASAARKYNINYKCLHQRLKNGWGIEEALLTPKMF